MSNIKRWVCYSKTIDKLATDWLTKGFGFRDSPLAIKGSHPQHEISRPMLSDWLCFYASSTRCIVVHWLIRKSQAFEAQQRYITTLENSRRVGERIKDEVSTYLAIWRQISASRIHRKVCRFALSVHEWMDSNLVELATQRNLNAAGPRLLPFFCIFIIAGEYI